MSLPPMTGRMHTVTVIQGEFAVSRRADEVLSTILGSCVATCMFDPRAGVGGMNHFLLPKAGEGVAEDLRYGTHAMELLINGLLGAGAARDQLRAKIFGGATMAEGLSDVGGANARFAHSFLAAENIPIISESLGGTMARRIRFHATTGRAQQMLVPNAKMIEKPRPSAAPAACELF